MAKTPTASAAAPRMPDDPTDAGDDTDTDAAGGADDSGDDSDTSDDAGDEDVLLTVCKESDGTYSLIKGDEEDADGTDAAGSADSGSPGAGDNKQMFDSIGALLKAILDILNEDKSSEGGDGSADDQFNAGFDESAAPTPAAVTPQKY